MHRQRRWAAVAAFAVMAGSVVAGVPAAGAAAGAMLYVDNTVASCSDSGIGTAAVPYCNVQAAFSAVSAGGTVIIEAGDYTIPATLSASGTAGAPITVWFGTPGAVFSSSSTPSMRGTTASPVLTVANASYVDIYNADVSGSSATAVSVTGSSHVAFAGGEIEGNGTTGLAISGASSDVSATRLTLTGSAAVSIGAGVSGTTLATNEIGGGEGVDIVGASGTDIVGNSLESECGDQISVSGAAVGTTIENNVIQTWHFSTSTCPTQVGLKVDADSTAGTTEKYDTILAFTSTAVDWAGADFADAATYQTATGQGAQDVIRSGTAMYGEAPSDYVDNADALVPGATTTDFWGSPREDDPYVANTGTGIGYFDRGATEETDRFSASIYDVEPVYGTAATYSVLWGYQSGWALCPKNYTATIDWGDGTSSTSSGTPCATASAKASGKVSPKEVSCIYSECFSVNHPYAHPGTYKITLTATDGTATSGNSVSVTTSSADYFAYGPTRILDTRKGIGVTKAPVKQGSYVKLKVAGVGGIPADVSAVAVNLTAVDATGNGYVAAEADGAGTPTISNLNYLKGQTIANSAIVSVAADGSIDVYNVGSGQGTADLIADVTGYFRPAAASGFAPATLARILDTRKGIGAQAAKVAGEGSVPVQVAGVDGIPASGVTAVAVHVTVTDTAGNGWIAAVPDGSATPTTSILNYREGQNVSNTVIVPVAADGEIRLYNGGSTTPVDLIADVAGYFSASAPNAYEPLPKAIRAVDTREPGNAALQPNASSHYWLPGNANIVAVIGNLTVTQPIDNGFIAAYPDGVTQPVVSNVNFLKGQTVANLAILDTNTSENPATNVSNSSNGTTELIIDAFGYFGS